MNEYDVIIVGAGPAGCAAAIEIARLDPVLGRRILILEKGVFPRPKLCGGGLTTHADALLAKLGLQLDVPSVPIHAVRIIYKDMHFDVPWRNAFRVVRREEFDTALALAAKARGVEMHEGEALRDMAAEDDGVELVTAGGTYRCKTLIGADGANSVVRQKLGMVRSDRISRLMEVLTPADTARARGFAEHTAVFDFTPIARRVQGYYWDFPTVKDGEPAMNRGIYDSRVYPGHSLVNLLPVFEERLGRREIELDRACLQGHPERWYDAAVKHSAKRVLLAGDAAGTEPLLGEGISHALDFGRTAARSAVRALGKNDWEYSDYERRIAWSALGLRLRAKRKLAQLIYANHGDWFYYLGFGLARLVLGRG